MPIQFRWTVTANGKTQATGTTAKRVDAVSMGEAERARIEDTCDGVIRYRVRQVTTPERGAVIDIVATKNGFRAAIVDGPALMRGMQSECPTAQQAVRNICDDAGLNPARVVVRQL